MESLTARALSIWNDLMVSIAVLESLLHSTLLLAWRLSFVVGFVLMVIVFVYMYFVPKKRRGSSAFCPPTSLTTSAGDLKSCSSFAPCLPTSGTKKLSGGAVPPPSSSFTVSSRSSTAKKPSNADDPCEVFINHRGPDVKLTLASILYSWLSDKKLRVFLDQKEIRPGKDIQSEIKQAIDNASVHIAIFSKRYAESRYCLEELCLMLNRGVKIIPVFFDVKRSDLRWSDQKRKGQERESLYHDAFDTHKRKGRYSSQKLQEWKTALEKVSFEDGLELKEMYNGDWGELLKRLVDDVLKATGREMGAASPQ